MTRIEQSGNSGKPERPPHSVRARGPPIKAQLVSAHLKKLVLDYLGELRSTATNPFGYMLMRHHLYPPNLNIAPRTEDQWARQWQGGGQEDCGGKDGTEGTFLPSLLKG